MAASAAASVVWLTAELFMVPTAGLLSGLAADFAAGLAVFDSDFLFVTGAFDCTATAFAVTLDKGFALDDAAAVLVPAFVAFSVALAGLPTDFSAATAGFVTFAFTVGFTVALFFTAAFAAGFAAAALGAADFAALTGEVRGFAGFFIAFAMESIPTKVALSHGLRA